ncbi:hypothetical protein FRC01_006790 [Tulasnella sp. 417]|nr:hypothetical protein FRC01_006790 [Tulasnella sp. 417]
MPATRSARLASQKLRPSLFLTKQVLDPEESLPFLQRAWIYTLSDALILIEAAMRGLIRRVLAKPPDSEKEKYSQSGNIFVFDEHETGIRRWTDPLSWSETRSSPPYFIYRETTLDIQKISSRRSSKARRRSSEDSPLLQHLIGAMPSGKRCRNHGYVMEEGMCKKTITIELPDRKWHIVSYYYVQDVLDGKFRRPSEMEHLQDLITSISPELLNTGLYYRKGRHCLLKVAEKNGRLVYDGEADLSPPRRTRESSTVKEEEDNVGESASSSTVPLPSHNVPRATIFHHPPRSWTGTYPEAPRFSSKTSMNTPLALSSPPPAYFNAVQCPPASPSSSSGTTTMSSLSGQGWELDDPQSFQIDPTSQSWAHQNRLNLPPGCGLFTSLPMPDVPESSSATPGTAWPSPSDSNMLWGFDPSLGQIQFGPSSSSPNYQLQPLGESSAGSTGFEQLAPMADGGYCAIAGLNQAMQNPAVWWDGSGSIAYGEFWDQTICN